MLRNILFVFGLLFLQACASHSLDIKSSTPARIEADGVIVCDSTPCNISQQCFRNGETTFLQAFPLDKSKGYTQVKNVSMECGIGMDNETKVFFEMDSRSGVAVENAK